MKKISIIITVFVVALLIFAATGSAKAWYPDNGTFYGSQQFQPHNMTNMGMMNYGSYNNYGSYGNNYGASGYGYYGHYQNPIGGQLGAVVGGQLGLMDSLFGTLRQQVFVRPYVYNRFIPGVGYEPVFY